VTVNKPNKFLQSVAQFPFLHAILKLESKKTERAFECALSFCLFVQAITMRKLKAPIGVESTTDLGALRLTITELVARNAVGMVQQAIDAVKEEGQYQAIKYLFEMIGLYPAAVQGESPVQESLAWTLLQQLGLPEVAPEKDGKEKSQPSIP
jgi:hypothetical protein